MDDSFYQSLRSCQSSKTQHMFYTLKNDFTLCFQKKFCPKGNLVFLFKFCTTTPFAKRRSACLLLWLRCTKFLLFCSKKKTRNASPKLWRTAKAEAWAAAANRWRVEVAIGNAAEDRVAAPTATAYHAIRAFTAIQVITPLPHVAAHVV